MSTMTMPRNSQTVPTPAQIQERTAEVRRSWTEEERTQRRREGANGLRFLGAAIKQRALLDAIRVAELQDAESAALNLQR